MALGTYLPSTTLDRLSDVIRRMGSTNSQSPGDSGRYVNMFGFYRSDLSYKLLNYLGYGNIVQLDVASGNRWWSTSLKNNDDSSSYTQRYIQNNFVNIFPLLAYQKIYQDFFRWSQWEIANPSSYNVDYYTGTTPNLLSDLPPVGSDYWKSDTLFDLKYCNWNKDMLMGVLPNSQFGDVAVIDLPSEGVNIQVADTTGKLHPVGTATVMNKGIATSPIGVDLSSGGTVNAGSLLSVDMLGIVTGKQIGRAHV